jgi:hypothetical protein
MQNRSSRSKPAKWSMCAWETKAWLTRSNSRLDSGARSPRSNSRARRPKRKSMNRPGSENGSLTSLGCTSQLTSPQTVVPFRPGSRPPLQSVRACRAQRAGCLRLRACAPWHCVTGQAVQANTIKSGVLHGGRASAEGEGAGPLGPWSRCQDALTGSWGLALTLGSGISAPCARPRGLANSMIHLGIHLTTYGTRHLCPHYNTSRGLNRCRAFFTCAMPLRACRMRRYWRAHGTRDHRAIGPGAARISLCPAGARL